jgi:aminopeptidase N
MNLYFKRFDGQAVTIEDFVACMADASGRVLKQFFRWYNQSGIPRLSVDGRYDAKKKTFEVNVEQSTPRLRGQTVKLPLHIPLALGLVDPDGKDLPLTLKGHGTLTSKVIELTKAKQKFTFTDVAKSPVLSINRGFTAPVVLKTNLKQSELLFLMGHDSDSFNRWEAAQCVAKALIVKTVRALKSKKALPSIKVFAEALGRSLSDDKIDDAFKALMLTLPTESEIAAVLAKDVDSDAVHQAREYVRSEIGALLLPMIRLYYASTDDEARYRPDPAGTARRSLRYLLLSYIAAADADAAIALARRDLARSSNMTVETGVLTSLLTCARPEREALLNEFYARHQSDHLIIDKWFSLNASIPGADASQRITRLLNHPDFKMTTPNRVYALLGGFSNNPSAFNAVHGTGYRLLADAIITLNAINPQVASRMATGFRSWRLYDVKRRTRAQLEMKRILASPKLSLDVFEIISRTLKA